jgi:drug/metabolite transporter (DMT)-like permease
MGLMIVMTLTVLALGTGFEPLPAGLPRDMLLLGVVSGCVQYALAFWLYLVGLRGLPVSVAGLFLTLTPVVGVIGGILFLGESLAPLQLAGAVLIVGAVGVMLAMKNESDATHDMQGP